MTEDLHETLPNLWHVCNLRESPYFQETLGVDPGRYPLSLFVGRRNEARQLLRTIGSSASSRQAIGGRPGIGKTTLVQSVKAEALRAGYLATDRLLAFYPDDTATAVLGRLLSGLYEAILTARPMTATSPAMQSAQQLVRVARLEGGGASLSILGEGGGVARSASVVQPAEAMMLDGPRVIRDLLGLVRESDARGVVLHLNNLENLAERDVRRAAESLRSLRDTVLLQDGVHVIVAGTGESVAAVVGTHPQVRSVFSTTLMLEALSAREVQALLAARYQHLVLDHSRPPVPPVSQKAVVELYPLFRGDLRSLFKVLEEGAMLLIGLTARPGVSIPLSELAPALRQRYAALVANLDPRRQAQLRLWARNPDAEHTQKTLASMWRISQPAVSVAIASLEQDGFVVSLGRQGAGPAKYALSGVGRLVFG